VFVNVVIRTAMRAIACAAVAVLPIAAQAGIAPPPFTGLGANGSVFAPPDGFGAARAKTQDAAAPVQYKQQLELAASAGLKIYVSHEGWQRVTRAAMNAAGFDPASDSRNLSLFMLGNEQSIVVDDGGDGKFDANDAIEFYGYPLDTLSTGARTYWLRAAKGPGNRAAVSKVSGGAPITGSVAFTYERVMRGIFASIVSSDDADAFFGALITIDPVNEPLTVSNLDTSYNGNANVEMVIQGGTDMAHRIDLALNGHSLGIVTLAGVEQPSFTFSVPQSWLANGTNNVTLTSLNGYDDVSVLARTRLTYQHLLRADNGAFDANVAGGRSVTIGGFASNRVRAFDVTDAQRPIELRTIVAADPQAGYAATFTTPAGGLRTIMTFDSSRVVTPSELAANTPSSWSDTNGNSNGSKTAASFYVISNRSFLSNAATLKSVRDGEGTPTEVVDVDDLYDEFNFGIRSPEAIRAFCKLASSWKHAPSAFLLLGDASVDPRNYLGMGTFDFVPTKLVRTLLLRTASDDWFTDFNGDGIADIPVGRIPVDTPAEAAIVIGKIASRGTPSGTWASKALFVADSSPDFDFAAVGASLSQQLPASMTSQIVDVAHTSNAHADIVDAMNSGSLLMTYIGHASVEIWSSSVFSSSDAMALTNGNRLPVVVALNCLNGYFHDVYTLSLAEALMKAPNGGAVAVWASSTLTEPDQQALMGHELFANLFVPNQTLGQAVARAKLVATDPDVRKSWILFGDPTMKLRP
jgi:hypothetical protein